MIKNKIDFNYFLKIYIIFTLFTLLLLDFGPVSYPLISSIKLHIYMILYILSFSLGYLFYKNKIISNKTIDSNRANNIISFNDNKINKLLRFGIYFNFLLFLIMTMNTTNSSSISTLISKTVAGLTNPANSYYEKVANGQSISNYLSLLFIFIYPYMLLILTLSIYRYKSMKLHLKIITILTTIIELSKWISLGTNKGIFDILILIISVLIIKKMENTYDEKKNKIRRTKMSLKTKIMIIVLGLCSFLVFNHFISNRMYDTSNTSVESIINGYKYFSNYLCNGYKGLDYSLSLNWEPTYGVGHSMFLVNQLDKHMGTNLNSLTYQKRAETYGWSSTIKWHTAYSWFANDISFVGVILLMFLFGAFCANLIYSIIIFHDYYSMVLFYLMMMFIFYASANNQVFSFVNTMVSFWFFLLLKMIRSGGKKWRRFRLVK